MSKHKINITINLDALRGELQRSLQKEIYLVSAGLQNIELIDPALLHLPTNGVTMIIDGSLSWGAEEVQKQYREWTLSNGFRDIVEGVSTFLESAHKVLSYWKIVGKQKSGSEIKGSDYNDIILSGRKKFHRLGLPDKIKHLETEHYIKPKFGEEVLSVNTARNCLVHRGGIVGNKDINNKNTLEVKWMRLAMILQNEDGENELILGQRVEKDGVIAIRNQEELRAFSVGEHVKFSVEEFYSAVWTLFLFGNDLVQEIRDFGLKNGFLSESKDND